MVHIKQILVSLIIPFIFAVLIPFALLVFLEKMLITQNLVFLIFGFSILGIGLLLFAECNWLFFKIGKGTLAPLPQIETKSMVIKGPYKYVRNPMIISVILILLAESFLFSSISILLYTGFFFLINVIYMQLSEEKGMITRFGEEYLHYKKNVRAWIPKTHPYSPVD